MNRLNVLQQRAEFLYAKQAQAGQFVSAEQRDHQLHQRIAQLQAQQQNKQQLIEQLQKQMAADELQHNETCVIIDVSISYC